MDWAPPIQLQSIWFSSVRLRLNRFPGRCFRCNFDQNIDGKTVIDLDAFKPILIKMSSYFHCDFHLFNTFIPLRQPFGAVCVLFGAYWAFWWTYICKMWINSCLHSTIATAITMRSEIYFSQFVVRSHTRPLPQHRTKKNRAIKCIKRITETTHTHTSTKKCHVFSTQTCLDVCAFSRFFTLFRQRHSFAHFFEST